MLSACRLGYNATSTHAMILLGSGATTGTVELSAPDTAGESSFALSVEESLLSSSSSSLKTIGPVPAAFNLLRTASRPSPAPPISAPSLRALVIPIPPASSFLTTLMWLGLPSCEVPRPLDGSHPNFCKCWKEKRFVSRVNGISLALHRYLKNVLTLTPCKISGIVSDLLFVLAFGQTHVVRPKKASWLRLLGRGVPRLLFSGVVHAKACFIWASSCDGRQAG